MALLTRLRHLLGHSRCGGLEHATDLLERRRWMIVEVHESMARDPICAHFGHDPADELQRRLPVMNLAGHFHRRPL